MVKGIERLGYWDNVGFALADLFRVIRAEAVGRDVCGRAADI